MKIRNILLAFVVIVFLYVFLSSNIQTGKTVDVSSMIENEEYNEIKDIYNQNLAQVPGIVKTLFGNEKINVYILMNDGSKKIAGIIMKKGIIDYLTESELDDPTMNVYLTEKTINKIANGELTAVDALNNGDIEYKSLTIKSGIKMGLASVGSKIASWF